MVNKKITITDDEFSKKTEKALKDILVGFNDNRGTKLALSFFAAQLIANIKNNLFMETSNEE